ncbi:hypothetical protein B296_00028446, partial [Ensete ventricosum]
SDLGHKSWDSTERVTSSTDLGDLAERAISGTNPGDLAERVISGTNPGDLAEGVISGVNLGDLAERVISSTNPGDLAERVISDTNPGIRPRGVTSGIDHGDLAEGVISGTNLGDLAERAISGTNPGDLAERVISSTNPGDLAERAISGINPRDLAERAISGTNHGDLAEGVISSTNLEDLTERVTSGTNLEDLAEGILSVGMTSDSSSIIRVISSPGSGGVSQSDPEASPSGVSSGPPLSVDSRALRDLEVMKADHDLDTTVNEGSLAVIRVRYSIPIEYGLHVPQPGQRPFSLDALDRMDLGKLRGMPKVSGGKAPSTRAVEPAREVSASPTRETPKASSKRLIDASAEQVDDPARRPKKVKVLTRRHKSRHSEGEPRSRSKGKEPAVPSEELETPAESDKGGASPVHHRPRSMKDLFKTKKVHKDDAGYYTLRMSDLGHRDPDKEMKMTLFDRVHDAGRLITFMDYRISNLQQELDALKSGGGPEAVAKAEERASELEQELGITKRERDEAL